MDDLCKMKIEHFSHQKDLATGRMLRDENGKPSEGTLTRTQHCTRENGHLGPCVFGAETEEGK